MRNDVGTPYPVNRKYCASMHTLNLPCRRKQTAPQLREYSDCVSFTPVFDNLAISKAVDSDADHDRRHTAWPDCDDQITFGNLRLDRELEIGKGAADALEMLFVPLNPRWLRGINATQWPPAR